MMESKLYDAVPDGCFRLLSFTDDSGLTCSLQTFQIEGAPPYIALSYTWTLPADEVKPGPYILTLNGHQVEVQQNLHYAMRHLAEEVRSKDCMLLGGCYLHQSG